jgi:hypothetical protein
MQFGQSRIVIHIFIIFLLAWPNILDYIVITLQLYRPILIYGLLLVVLFFFDRDNHRLYYFQSPQIPKANLQHALLYLNWTWSAGVTM